MLSYYIMFYTIYYASIDHRILFLLCSLFNKIHRMNQNTIISIFKQSYWYFPDHLVHKWLHSQYDSFYNIIIYCYVVSSKIKRCWLSSSWILQVLILQIEFISLTQSYLIYSKSHVISVTLFTLKDQDSCSSYNICCYMICPNIAKICMIEMLLMGSINSKIVNSK